ncbi:MAG: hypothetical protein KC609_22350, partial [Myxococcales bacterium]|nr:hypothetical protein [Myxococcales bacterium]
TGGLESKDKDLIDSDEGDTGDEENNDLIKLEPKSKKEYAVAQAKSEGRQEKVEASAMKFGVEGKGIGGVSEEKGGNLGVGGRVFGKIGDVSAQSHRDQLDDSNIVRSGLYAAGTAAEFSAGGELSQDKVAPVLEAKAGAKGGMLRQYFSPMGYLPTEDGKNWEDPHRLTDAATTKMGAKLEAKADFTSFESVAESLIGSAMPLDYTQSKIRNTPMLDASVTNPTADPRRNAGKVAKGLMPKKEKPLSEKERKRLEDQQGARESLARTSSGRSTYYP